MSVVTDYIEKLNDKERAVLQQLRDIVYETVPDTEDAFSYGIPTYKYKGKYLLAFASNKNFMSIYPGTEPIEVFKDALTSFKTSRGTISFTVDHTVPDELLRNIVTLCKDRIEARLQK